MFALLGHRVAASMWCGDSAAGKDATPPFLYILSFFSFLIFFGKGGFTLGVGGDVRMLYLTVGVALVCMMGIRTEGLTESVAPADAVERVKEQMHLFAGWQPPAPSMWTIDTTTYATMDQSALQALRDRVKGRPEHPDRGLLAEAERLAANGSEVERAMIYFGTEGRVRVDRIRDGKTVEVSVLTPTEQWYAAGAGAYIVPATGEAIPGRSVRHMRSLARNMAGQFVFGLVTMVPKTGATLEDAPDGWGVTITVAERGVVMRLDFASPDDVIGTSSRIVRADGAPGLIGQRREAVVKTDAPQPAVVSEFRSLTAAGRLESVQRLISITHDVPDDVFVLPMDQPPLATSGRLDVVQIDDLRGGEPGIRLERKEGKWQTQGEVYGPVTEARRAFGYSGLIICIIAGMIVVGAFLIYNKRDS